MLKSSAVGVGGQPAGAQKPLALVEGAPIIPGLMRLRFCLCLLFAAALSACFEPYKKKDEEDRKPLRNMANDTSFQAFVGRLRIAVHKKDVPMVSSLMTPDFGYTWEESAQPSAQIFALWDEKNLWPVLEGLLEKKFAPQELYMVSPPELVTDPAYNGPRCGMRVIGGSWKFAYFLPQGQP
jgi:hypothetical protein